MKKVTEFVRKNKVISVILFFVIIVSLGGLVIYLTKKPEKKKPVVKKPPVKKPPPKVEVKTTVVEEPEPAPETTVGTITGQTGPVGFGTGGGGGSGGASYDRSSENKANAAKYKSKRDSLSKCQKRTGGTCVEKGNTGLFFDSITESSSLVSLEDAMVKAHNDARSSCDSSKEIYEWDEDLAVKAGECFTPNNDNCRETNVSTYNSVTNSSGKTYNTSDNFSELAVNSWKNYGPSRKEYKRLFSNLSEDRLFGCAQKIPDLNEDGVTDNPTIIRCLYDNYDTELNFDDDDEIFCQ